MGAHKFASCASFHPIKPSTPISFTSFVLLQTKRHGRGEDHAVREDDIVERRDDDKSHRRRKDDYREGDDERRSSNSKSERSKRECYDNEEEAPRRRRNRDNSPVMAPIDEEGDGFEPRRTTTNKRRGSSRSNERTTSSRRRGSRSEGRGEEEGAPKSPESGSAEDGVVVDSRGEAARDSSYSAAAELVEGKADADADHTLRGLGDDAGLAASSSGGGDGGPTPGARPSSGGGATTSSVTGATPCATPCGTGTASSASEGGRKSASPLDTEAAAAAPASPSVNEIQNELLLSQQAMSADSPPPRAGGPSTASPAGEGSTRHHRSAADEAKHQEGEEAKLRELERQYNKGLELTHGRRSSFGEHAAAAAAPDGSGGNTLKDAAGLARPTTAASTADRNAAGADGYQTRSLAFDTQAWVKRHSQRRRLSTGSTAEALAEAIAATGAPAYTPGVGHSRAWIDVSDKTLTSLLDGSVPPSEAVTKPMFGARGSLAPHPIRAYGRRKEEEDQQEIARARASGVFVGSRVPAAAGMTAAQRLYAQASESHEKRAMLAALAAPQYPFHPEIDRLSRTMDAAAHMATTTASTAAASGEGAGEGGTFNSPASDAATPASPAAGGATTAQVDRHTLLYQRAQESAAKKAQLERKTATSDPNLTFKPAINERSRKLVERAAARQASQVQRPATAAVDGGRGGGGGTESSNAVKRAGTSIHEAK